MVSHQSESIDVKGFAEFVLQLVYVRLFVLFDLELERRPADVERDFPRRRFLRGDGVVLADVATPQELVVRLHLPQQSGSTKECE